LIVLITSIPSNEIGLNWVIYGKFAQTYDYIFSIHILDDIQRVSDRVIILNYGELIAQCSVEELLSTVEGES